MSKRNSVRTPWRQGWYIIVRLIVASAYVLLTVPVTQATPVDPVGVDPGLTNVQSLDGYLDSNGTLPTLVEQIGGLVPSEHRWDIGQGKVLSFAPVNPETVPGDENWVNSPLSLPGLNGPVYALAVDMAGNLYAGGNFTLAGGVSANTVAKWNGVNWSPLGSGMDYVVRALAVDAAGNLYAGGEFTTAGGVAANRIAKWNGNAWSAVGSGANDHVYALSVDSSGNLYAGGRFTAAGGTAANHIARWNGSTWSALGSGTSDWVYSLAISSSGIVYAGGSFSMAGGAWVGAIAQWNGHTWSSVGGGMNDWVHVLAFDRYGNLYAGGRFTVAGGIGAKRIARWDGSAWSPLGSGMNAAVYALTFDAAGNLYAGGGFSIVGGNSTIGIARWGNNTWTTLGTGVNNSVHTLTIDRRGNLFAGGDFTLAGGVGSSFVGQWIAADGTSGITGGSYTFYANNLPVAIRVNALGNLHRLSLQRFNRNHIQASPDLNTGYYWAIVGSDVYGNPATGYTVDLTLPTTFTPDDADQLCRFTGSTWDCAGTTHTANSITRTGITQLSDWTVANRTQEPLTTWNAEAEQGTRSGSMAVGTDSAASACHYVADATANSGGAVTFNVNVPYDGLYYLWARVKGMGWNNNSFFVSVNGAPQLHYEVPQFAGNWDWGWDAIHENNQAVVPFYLNTGVNTVRFQTREANARLDRVFLVNRTGSAPTMVAPCTIPHSHYVPFVPRGR